MDFIHKAFVYLAIGLTFAGALACGGATQKALYVSTDGRPGIWINAEAPGYDAAKEILTDVPSEPAIQVVYTDGRPEIRIEEASSGCDADEEILYNDVPSEPVKSFAECEVDSKMYEEVKDALGIQILPDDEASAARWKENLDHWDSVNVIRNEIAGWAAEKCPLPPQWKNQLTAALDYVENYREVEPHIVKNNPTLENLQRTAENSLRSLDLADQILCN